MTTDSKGSVESLVKWVKGNFLAGRTFADDTDLAEQCREWLDYANGVTGRPSQATDELPVVRLAEEAVKGGPLPATARAGDYGFLYPARVSPEALVAVLGNQYSVPILHVGAPVAVRVHRERIVLWRDTTRLAEHARAPDGAHQRVVEPEHYSLLFAKKPRAQVMLYREALIALGQTARWYVSEVSRRRRAQLREEVVGLYTLYQQMGAERLLAAMDYATERSVYGVEYLRAVLELAERPTWPTLFGPPPPALFPATVAGASPSSLALAAPVAPTALVGVPSQQEVDRALDSYERYAQDDASAAGEGSGHYHQPTASAARAGTVEATAPTEVSP